MENFVKIKDVLSVCDKRLKGTSTDKEFLNWLLKNIRIRNYLPISTKAMVVETVSNDVSKTDMKDMTKPEKVVLIEIYNLFFGILTYTNVDFSREDLTTENYDTLMASGFVETVLNVCGNDYKALRNMFLESMFVSILDGVNFYLGGDAEKQNTKALNAINRILKNKEGMNTLLEVVKLSGIEEIKKTTKVEK